MSEAPPDWDVEYRPLLGRRLEGAAFLALAMSDSPEVMRDLREPVIGFSGSVLLGFEAAPDFFLTWAQLGAHEFGLTTHRSVEERWGRFSLDRITISAEDPWGRLNEARFSGVTLYSTDEVEGGYVIAAAHRFQADSAETTLWACTASGEHVSSGDDLLVSIDVEPPLSSALVTIKTIQ